MSTTQTSPERKFVEFRRTLAVEWGHCDPAGIIFHPRFLEYFDWNTALLFESATGHSKAKMREVFGLGGLAVAEIQVKFLRPATFGDTMEIVSSITALGKSSFQLQHSVLINGELCVDCTQTRVWCVPNPSNPRQLKSQPLPAAVVAKLTRT
jgi:4-hydroxybenzoyl-CoA thioesterase